MKQLLFSCLDKGKITSEKLKISSELSEAVLKLKSLLYTDRPALYTGDELAAFETLGNILYDELLHPILKQTRSNSIIVQPDGVLHGLPFGLMIMGKIASHEKLHAFRDLNYVLKDYDVSYWMGLDSDFNGRRKAAGKILLVACLPNKDSGNMASELEAIEEVFENTNIEIEWADEQIPIRNFSDYQLIHFASHYQMNDRDPLKSGLVCSSASTNPYITLDDILADNFSNSRIFRAV